MKIETNSENNNTMNQKVRTLNNNSQWLKHLAPGVMNKEFVVSLCADLEGNQEFSDLIFSIQKLSSELVSDSQLGQSSCYDNLRQTNDEIAHKMLRIEQMLTNQVLVEVSSNYSKNQHTHAGLVNYLFYAWANDFGICLRPDMLYYTIISETMTHILSNAEQFQHLLIHSSDSVIIENEVDNLPEHLLQEQLLNILNNIDFKTHIVDVKFDSQPENFSFALGMCFFKRVNEQQIPVDPMCGIPSIEILGNKQEWIKLLDTIAKLSTFVPSLGDYYVQCSDAINELVSARFCGFNNDSDSFNDENVPEKLVEFLSNIFWINGECESNHSVVLSGWFKKFYILQWDYLELYPTHSNYVSYKNQSVDNLSKNFIKVCGLNYSKLENNTLYPQYGESVYEVRHSKIFELLEGKNNVVITDEHKVKSMIKSTLGTKGYNLSDEEVKNVYNSMIQEKSVFSNNFSNNSLNNQGQQNSQITSLINDRSIIVPSIPLVPFTQSAPLKSNDVSLTVKLINAFTSMSTNTTTTLTQNWKTTLVVTTVAIISAVAIKFNFR